MQQQEITTNDQLNWNLWQFYDFIIARSDEKLARMNMLGTKAKSERYRFLIRSTRQRAWACKLQLLLFPRSSSSSAGSLDSSIDFSASPLQSLALVSAHQRQEITLPQDVQQPIALHITTTNQESNVLNDMNSWIPQPTTPVYQQVVSSNDDSASMNLSTTTSPMIPTTLISEPNTLQNSQESSIELIPVAHVPATIAATIVSSEQSNLIRNEWTQASIDFPSFESLLASIPSGPVTSPSSSTASSSSNVDVDSEVQPGESAHENSQSTRAENHTDSSESSRGMMASAITELPDTSAGNRSASSGPCPVTLAAVAAAAVPATEPAEGVIPELPEVHVVQHVTSCIDDVVGNPDPYQPRKKSPLKRPNPDTIFSPTDSDSETITSPTKSPIDKMSVDASSLLPEPPRLSRKRSSSNSDEMSVDSSVSNPDDDMTCLNYQDRSQLHGSCDCGSPETSKRCRMSIAYPSPPEADLAL